MSAVPKRKLTSVQYFAIERTAEFKSEFYDGEMFAMAGASPTHCFIRDNVSAEIHVRIRGSSCRTASSDLRVKFDPTGLYTYPDIVIVCGEPQYDPDDSNTLVNPRVVVEVLSPSTELYDRTTKFRQFQQLPSAMEYLLISQHEALVEQYVRQDDGSWKYYSYAGIDASFSLMTVPVRDVLLADVYSGIEFAAP